MSNWKIRIATNPAQCGGQPCIRGMRIRVLDVINLLDSGLSKVHILQELPDLEIQDIEAALEYVNGISKAHFVKEFQDSVNEVNLAKRGKVTLKTADQLLEEL